MVEDVLADEDQVELIRKAMIESRSMMLPGVSLLIGAPASGVIRSEASWPVR